MNLRRILPGPTQWRFVDSSGAEFSFGAGEFLNFGVAGGKIHVKEGLMGPVRTLLYGGIKAGAGAGVSISSLLSASASNDMVPSRTEGVGCIYKGLKASESLTIDDFVGNFTLYNFSGGAFVAGGVSLILMGLWFPMTSLALAAAMCNAGAVFFDVHGTTSVSLEVNITQGWLSPSA